jgi:putative spermidine/putrescine transport system substrate-binding protein
MTQITRRRLGLGALSASTMLAAPHVAWAQSRELVMGSLGGTLDAPYRRAADAVERRNRGVSIRLVPSLSAEVIARVKAARGDSPFDMTTMEAPALLLGVQEDVFERIDLSRIPNAARLDPKYLPEAHGWGVPTFYTGIGIAYNRSMVPNPPTSWADLWNPAFRGKIGLARPSSNLGLASLAVATSVSGGTDADLEPGMAKWRELQPVIARSPAILTQMLERGEIAACILWHSNTAIAASKGLPIGFVKPAPVGMMVLASSAVVFRTSANKELAYEYINELIAPEQQRFAAGSPYFFGITITGVTPPPDSAAFLPANPQEVSQIKEIDWTRIVPVRGRLVEAFDRMYSL